ncbi:Phosphoglycerate mutase [Entamoeba marina]
MTKLLLIRHGETEWNLYGKIQGVTDVALSESGIEQARQVQQRINGTFDVIYSSPLIRALYTANAISNHKHEVKILEGLREIPFGNWEGRRFEDLEGDPFYAKFKSGEDGMPLGNGITTISKAAKDNSALLKKICKENEGKTIVIVSHGAWIKSAMLGLLDLHESWYHRFMLGNTGITTFVFKEDVPVLSCFNDTSHLPNGNRSKTG